MPSEQPYLDRRQEALKRMGPDSVLIVPATPLALRNHDQEHTYRPSSDIVYLTGFEEPECVLVLSTAHKDEQFVMWVRPRDAKKERWEGIRLGVDNAKTVLGVDTAYPIESLDQTLNHYLEGAECLYYALGEQPVFDAKVGKLLVDLRRGARRGTQTPTVIKDTAVILHEMRLIKSADEIHKLRASASLTAKGHARALTVAQPGAHEYVVEAAFNETLRREGCRHLAYPPIVGSGPNATILHYRDNQRLMQDGDLLLIDAGAELDYYATDVTRTFPLNGRFTPPQRALYEVVLAAQNRAIAAIKPGANLDQVHQAALETIVEGLLELRLLSGTKDEVIEKRSYTPFYMHRTSHWLGMDVHDVGWYYLDGRPRPLEAGMVFTVEPGIYVSEEASVSAEWKSIGIRIEDDIVVTAQGFEVLTEQIPKTVEDLEGVLASR